MDTDYTEQIEAIEKKKRISELEKQFQGPVCTDGDKEYAQLMTRLNTRIATIDRLRTVEKYAHRDETEMTSVQRSIEETEADISMIEATIMEMGLTVPSRDNGAADPDKDKFHHTYNDPVYAGWITFHVAGPDSKPASKKPYIRFGSVMRSREDSVLSAEKFMAVEKRVTVMHAPLHSNIFFSLQKHMLDKEYAETRTATILKEHSQRHAAETEAFLKRVGDTKAAALAEAAGKVGATDEVNARMPKKRSKRAASDKSVASGIPKPKRTHAPGSLKDLSAKVSENHLNELMTSSSDELAFRSSEVDGWQKWLVVVFAKDLNGDGRRAVPFEEFVIHPIRTFHSLEEAEHFAKYTAAPVNELFDVDVVPLYEWLPMHRRDAQTDTYREKDLDVIMKAPDNERSRVEAFRKYCAENEMDVPVVTVGSDGVNGKDMFGKPIVTQTHVLPDGSTYKETIGATVTTIPTPDYILERDLRLEAEASSAAAAAAAAAGHS